PSLVPSGIPHPLPVLSGTLPARSSVFPVLPGQLPMPGGFPLVWTALPAGHGSHFPVLPRLPAGPSGLFPLRTVPAPSHPAVPPGCRVPLPGFPARIPFPLRLLPVFHSPSGVPQSIPAPPSGTPVPLRLAQVLPWESRHLPAQALEKHLLSAPLPLAV